MHVGLKSYTTALVLPCRLSSNIGRSECSVTFVSELVKLSAISLLCAVMISTLVQNHELNAG